MLFLLCTAVSVILFTFLMEHKMFCKLVPISNMWKSIIFGVEISVRLIKPGLVLVAVEPIFLSLVAVDHPRSGQFRG